MSLKLNVTQRDKEVRKFQRSLWWMETKVVEGTEADMLVYPKLRLFCFITLMSQTTQSIQRQPPLHFSKSLPTLSKFQFKHITQMFTFSREILEFSSGYTKIEFGSLWSNKSPPTQKQRQYCFKKKIKGGREFNGQKSTERFQRWWEIMNPPKLIYVMNQAFFLATPNWPKSDLHAYST